MVNLMFPLLSVFFLDVGFAEDKQDAICRFVA